MLSELEKLAELAKSGPWRDSNNDLAFIAAATPGTILKLIAVVKAVKVERKKMIDTWPEPLDADDTEAVGKALAAIGGWG